MGKVLEKERGDGRGRGRFKEAERADRATVCKADGMGARDPETRRNIQRQRQKETEGTDSTWGQGGPRERTGLQEGCGRESHTGEAEKGREKGTQNKLTVRADTRASADLTHHRVPGRGGGGAGGGGRD